ncbi:hypothetical protein EGT07_12960 [Herbaspirillum sp. HC18]|nr:hypothetical protein EGT07_12960 [Herbaspirillum sp. HC18]
MRKTSLALFLSMLTLAGAGFAATPSPTSEIRESTDPAKADEVMRHASEIQARQQAADQEMTSGSSGTKSGKSKHGKKSKKHSKSAKPAGSSGSSGGADASGASSSGGQEAGSSTSK